MAGIVMPRLETPLRESMYALLVNEMMSLWPDDGHKIKKNINAMCAMILQTI